MTALRPLPERLIHAFKHTQLRQIDRDVGGSSGHSAFVELEFGSGSDRGKAIGGFACFLRRSAPSLGRSL